MRKITRKLTKGGDKKRGLRKSEEQEARIFWQIEKKCSYRSSRYTKHSYTMVSASIALSLHMVRT